MSIRGGFSLARPWTGWTNDPLSCSRVVLAIVSACVRAHLTSSEGKHSRFLIPFSGGDFLTTSWPPPFSQVNESGGWSSAEASSGPVSLNLGVLHPPPLFLTLPPFMHLPQEAQALGGAVRRGRRGENRGPATLYALTWLANPARLNKLNLHLWNGANQRAKNDLCK